LGDSYVLALPPQPLIRASQPLYWRWAATVPALTKPLLPAIKNKTKVYLWFWFFSSYFFLPLVWFDSFSFPFNFPLPEVWLTMLTRYSPFKVSTYSWLPQGTSPSSVHCNQILS
jgi:hypothetical protein